MVTKAKLEEKSHTHTDT